MKNGTSALVIASLIGGAVIGAAIGLLFAPEKGEDQRRKIKDALDKRGIKLGKEELNKLIDEIKNIGRKCPEAECTADYDAE